MLWFRTGLVILAIGYAIGYVSLFSACNDNEICCSAIQTFTVEPQYICPGDIDFAPKVHFRIDNFDKDENRCESTYQWQLWETTGGAAGSTGAKKLASPKTHNLLKVGKGAYATPNQGIPGAPSPTPGGRQFTLIAKNAKCPGEAQNYMIENQKKYEEKLGLELDDGKLMQATIQILQLSTNESRHKICFHHLIDLTSSAPQWKREVNEFGSKTSIPYIEMVGVANPNPVAIEVTHKPPGPTANKLGWVIQPNGFVNLGDSMGPSVPRNPNGTWEVKISDAKDYAKYMKHGLDYLGPPPICVEITARCK